MATTTGLRSGVAVHKTTKVVKVRAFGRYLKKCRLQARKRVPSVEAVAKTLREQGIDVNHATIRGYEYGWADRPDPSVLGGLARLYKIDVRSLIEVLTANRRNRNLSEIDVASVLRTVKQTSHAEAEASTRLAEIRDRIVGLSAELLELAGEQTPTPRQHPAERTHGDRKDRG